MCWVKAVSIAGHKGHEEVMLLGRRFNSGFQEFIRFLWLLIRAIISLVILVLIIWAVIILLRFIW
jgi:hypothetical protein